MSTMLCVEDLDMKAMSRALNFGKSVSDNGWGIFRNMLTYKLTEEGKQIVKIDKWFPSSKTCSHCGAVKSELDLSERVYHCECGFVAIETSMLWSISKMRAFAYLRKQ